MTNLLSTDDPEVLRAALFQAWRDIQDLERKLIDIRTEGTRLTEDVIDYLDRETPNTAAAIRRSHQILDTVKKG